MTVANKRPFHTTVLFGLLLTAALFVVVIIGSITFDLTIGKENLMAAARAGSSLAGIIVILVAGYWVFLFPRLRERYNKEKAFFGVGGPRRPSLSKSLSCPNCKAEILDDEASPIVKCDFCGAVVRQGAE
jgi:hypothetical protein